MGRIFFSFSGRIGRQTFWLAILALVVVVIALLVAAGAVLGMPDPRVIPAMSKHPFFTAAMVVSLMILWPSLAVTVKRLHDRAWSAWWLTGFYAMSFIPFAVAMAPAIGLPILAPGGALSLVMAALTLVILAASFWLLVETGFLPGTEGANRFGEDPLGASSDSAAARPRDDWAG